MNLYELKHDCESADDVQLKYFNAQQSCIGQQHWLQVLAPILNLRPQLVKMQLIIAPCYDISYLYVLLSSIITSV